MSSTEEEVDGRPVDEIAKIAGPVGGLWVAWNDHGISGASFANTTTFARFREEHHDRTGRGAAHADSMPDDLFDLIEQSTGQTPYVQLERPWGLTRSRYSSPVTGCFAPMAASEATPLACPSRSFYWSARRSGPPPNPSCLGGRTAARSCSCEPRRPDSGGSRLNGRYFTGRTP